MSRKCKKSLYKSTYKDNAFTKGESYNIVEEDDNFFYLTDNKGRSFNFSKLKKLPYYWVDDYFY